MGAGYNVKARIWRMVQETDDTHGGAVFSGTVAYACVASRLTPRIPSMLLVDQGIETEKMAVAEVRPASLVIVERDEYEIIGPLNHPYYGDRWRIVSVQSEAVHPSDSRAAIHLVLSRIQEARTVQ